MYVSPRLLAGVAVVFRGISFVATKVAVTEVTARASSAERLGRAGSDRSVARFAALLHAEPLVTFAAAALLLGEQATAVVIAGGVLVLASVLIAQYAPAVRQPLEEA